MLPYVKEGSGLIARATATIRVLIVDSHPVFRKGMELICGKTSDIAISYGIGDGVSALTILRARVRDFNCVLLDISLPGRTGMEVLADIKKEFPDLPVIMLSSHSEEMYGLRCLKAGAFGYVSKTSSVETILEAIRQVHQGGRYFGALVMDQMVFEFEKKYRKYPHELLSQRQFQILCMLATGRTVSEVARELNLRLTTVSTHRANILSKMKMSNNAQLMHYALKHDLVK